MERWIRNMEEEGAYRCFGLPRCGICFKCCYPEYYYTYDGYNPMDSFDPNDIVVRKKTMKEEKKNNKRTREVLDICWKVFVQN
jgi:hypothetical protein